jgi:hypothetical protein
MQHPQMLCNITILFAGEVLSYLAHGLNPFSFRNCLWHEIFGIQLSLIYVAITVTIRWLPYGAVPPFARSLTAVNRIIIHGEKFTVETELVNSNFPKSSGNSVHG